MAPAARSSGKPTSTGAKARASLMMVSTSAPTDTPRDISRRHKGRSRAGKRAVQAALAHPAEQGADGRRQQVVLAHFLAQRQQRVAAVLEHLAAEPAQFLGLVGDVAQRQALGVERALHRQHVDGVVERMLGLFEVAVEGAARPAVHHRRHRRDIVVVGVEHLAVAARDRHVGLLRLGALGQFEDRVAVAVELLADLPEQLGQLVGGLAQQIHVASLHAFVELAGGVGDGVDARTEHRRQAELVLAGQAADEFEHVGVELVGLAARLGLQDVGIDQLAQRLLLLVGRGGLAPAAPSPPGCAPLRSSASRATAGPATRRCPSGRTARTPAISE